MTSRRLALVILPLVVLVSCGGDDGGGSAFGDPVAEEADSTGSGDDASTDASGDSGSDSEIDLSGDYVMPSAECIEASMAMLTALGSATDDPSALYELPDMLGSLRDKMPSEIADDLEVVIKEFQRYGEILQEYGDDMMAAFADPELSTLMTSDEYLAANERLNAWFENECGG